MQKTTRLTAMAGLAAILLTGGVTASSATAPATSGAPLAQIPAETSPLIEVGYWRGYYGYPGYRGYGYQHRYGHRGYGHRYGHRWYGTRYGYGYRNY